MTHRVAVIPYGVGLGDMVNMRPLLQSIVRCRPSSFVFALSPAAYESLLPSEVQAIHSIRGVPIWERPSRNSLVGQALRTISPRTSAPIIRLLGSERWTSQLSVLLRQQGFQEVINLLEAFSSMDLDDRWTPGPWNPPAKHVIDIMASFLQTRQIDIPFERRVPVLPRPQIVTHVAPAVVLNPNAGTTLKEPTIDFWVQLAHALAGINVQSLLLRGLQGGIAEEIWKRTSLTRLISTPNIPTLQRFLSSSSVVVSPDTGVLHVAAALGVPYVGLFGPTDPRFLGPYHSSSDDIVLTDTPREAVCRGCWTAQLLPRAACGMKYEQNCLSSLNPDEVFARVQSKLACHHGSEPGPEMSIEMSRAKAPQPGF